MIWNCLKLLPVFMLFLGIMGCQSSSAYAPVTPIQQKTLANSLNGYRVQQSDNVYVIAWKLGVDFRQLTRANHLQAPYQLTPGEVLTTKIPASLDARWLRQESKKNDKNQIDSRWSMPAQGRVENQFSTALFSKKGITIVGQIGSPIVAAFSGSVVYVGDNLSGYGNLILVKHGDSYLSAYAFINKSLVNVGETVRQGQKIATMGRGPNKKSVLRFEVRYNGQPINPLRYIR